MSRHATAKSTNPEFGGECLLTILIPCLNEAETIESCVRKAQAFLSEARIDGEVLVADNGSTDGSQGMAAACGARVVQTITPGYGGALGGGIASARGRFVIMGDADDSYDLRNLSAFIERLQDGADLVMGNRFQGGIASGAMPFLHRYLGNPVLTWIGRLLFRAPVSDFHCGLRGFRRDRILELDLRTTGMEFASEMVVRASLARLNIVEVPTTLDKDGRSRPPHLKTWRDGWRHLRFLLLHSPRWTFGYPGAFLISISLALMTILFIEPLHLGRTVTFGSHTLLFAGIINMLGIQLLTFAVLARRYAHRSGILPDRSRGQRFLANLSLEKMLGASAVLIAGGGLSMAWLVCLWVTQDFGVMHHEASLRWMIISSTALASGVQLGFSAFLLGVLDLPAGGARLQLQLLQTSLDADALA